MIRPNTVIVMADAAAAWIIVLPLIYSSSFDIVERRFLVSPSCSVVSRKEESTDNVEMSGI